MVLCLLAEETKKAAKNMTENVIVKQPDKTNMLRIQSEDRG